MATTGALLASGAGFLQGPPALVLLVIAWVFVPSAGPLSRRLALNGAVALGVIPVLWWLKWPALAGVSHSGGILAALVGFLVLRLLGSPRQRRVLLPKVSLADLIPTLGSLFALWFFLPLLRVQSQLAGVAMLINGWGNDNVAHFDMFSMIRREAVTGLGWPEALGGLGYTYTNYPQHFHVLTAFAAELVHGPTRGSIGTEVALFGAGTALVLSAAIITLLAAIASCRPLRGRPGIALIVGVAAVSILLLGMGSDALSYGFPGFLLAIIATLIACVIGLGTQTTGPKTLLALAGLLVAVAHTWSLLAPIALVPLIFAALRYPWRDALRRRSGRLTPGLLPPVLVALFAVSGVVYSAILIHLATSSVGSVASVLKINGGFPPVSVALAAALAAAVIVVAVLWWWLRRQQRTGAAALASAQIGVSATIGAGLAIALVIVQLRQGGALSYYQYKYLYGITIIFGVLFFLLVGAWLASKPRAGGPQSGRTADGRALLSVAKLTAGSWRPAARVAVICLLAAAALGSSFVAAPLREPVAAPAGVAFRVHLQDSASSGQAMAARTLAAAELMQSSRCRRPIYLALVPGDPPANESNQWAMSFSGRWTESAQPINAQLAELPRITKAFDPSEIVDRLLSADAGRCVILASQLKAATDPALIRRYAGRIESVDW